MKKAVWLLGLVLLTEFSLLLYSNRARLTSLYDSLYWKDRYEHSQWQLPLSTRTLGDNGLYAYEGYLLMQGADPTKYNAEIPPLGKYAIGAVILLTRNDYWFGVAATLAAGMLYYLLAKKVLKETVYALSATALVALSPFFASQWTATMLDSLHLAAFILFFLLLRRIRAKNSPMISILLAGVALGIFSAVKYPIFSVILALAGAFYIWRARQSVRDMVVFLASAILTYLTSYLQYFLLGHTITDWLGVQKWMFSFYTHGMLSANTGSIWTTLLFNRYQNLFTKQWETVPEWSITLPAATIACVYLCYRFFRDKRKSPYMWQALLGASVVLIMVFYTFTSFWTRYLLLIVPFLYLGAVAALRIMRNTKIAALCIILFIAVNAYSAVQTIFPTPEQDVRQFVSDWEHGFFQDMYERFSVSAKAGTGRYDFNRSMQSLVQDGEIEATNITLLPAAWNSSTSHQYFTLRVVYSTRALGEFSDTVTVPVIQDNGQWHIPWKPVYFIPGLAPGAALRTTVYPARRGSIIQQGRVLARDFPSEMVVVTPTLVDATREQQMLKYLERLFGTPRFSAVGLYHRYIVNSQPDRPVPVGVLPVPEDQSILDTLRSYPGITLTPALGRYESPDFPQTGIVANTHFHECCSYLYSTTPYDGLTGLEKTYNPLLKGENGGMLELVARDGSVIRTLITKEIRDGTDVSL